MEEIEEKKDVENAESMKMDCQQTEVVADPSKLNEVD